MTQLEQVMYTATAHPGDPAPAGLSDKENAAFKSLNDLYTKDAGYAGMMVTRPQTLGYGIHPVMRDRNGREMVDLFVYCQMESLKSPGRLVRHYNYQQDPMWQKSHHHRPPLKM